MKKISKQIDYQVKMSRLVRSQKKARIYSINSKINLSRAYKNSRKNLGMNHQKIWKDQIDKSIIGLSRIVSISQRQWETWWWMILVWSRSLISHYHNIPKETLYFFHQGSSQTKSQIIHLRLKDLICRLTMMKPLISKDRMLALLLQVQEALVITNQTFKFILLRN